MAVLSSKKILQEKNTSDPSSITSLTLTHRALSDVSCLSEFKNLERLDLSFNNLTSLEGLKACANLKWLSVVQNKLQSLGGIEGLTKLAVLNAGKNKLKSMDELKSLGSLRALILNENEISLVCKLDQMKELNTLVLSRNPISSLGESFVKVKSITKLSLSNCQLQSIDSSLKSCTELKELRLAHNEIKTISSEFSRLLKLQNLDMGNNFITSWSNVKVLSSLVNLRNLNLKGNPVAEKGNVLKKVKKLLPNLQIFNAKPIDKISVKEVPEKDEVFSVGDKLAFRSDAEMDFSSRNKTSEKSRLEDESTDNHFNNATDLKKREKIQNEVSVDSGENANISEKKMKKRLKLQQNEGGTTDHADTLIDPNKEKKSRHKRHRKESDNDTKLGSVETDNKPDKKPRKKIKGGEAIDSADIPFTDLFATEAPMETSVKEIDGRINRNIDAGNGLVTHLKRKKKKRGVNPATLEMGLGGADEIGLGGPSAWGDV